MNLKGLMVGDWVSITTYPGTRYEETDIERVTSVNEFGAITLFDGSGDGLYNEGMEEVRIEPIPLTPEILEKNGYTCKRSLDKEIISYNWTSPDRRVTLNDQNGLPWFCIIRSDGMMEEVMLGITYVHELQHALRLCRIEKGVVV